MGEFDNSYLASLAAADREHLAAVGLVDHRDTDCRAVLRRSAAAGAMAGLRLSIEALTAAPQLADEAVDLGLAIVLFAPGALAGAVDRVSQFLERRPSARVVVSHLGNPQISASGRPADQSAVLDLAGYANVYWQISGMGMFCPWPHEPLYDLVGEAHRRFGASRLCWGSNFPVVGGLEAYQSDLALLVDGKLPLPQADIPAIAGGNARGLWFDQTPRG
jgi:predicted TIM-barrel fold metal-dependent hydrolase